MDVKVARRIDEIHVPRRCTRNPCRSFNTGTLSSFLRVDPRAYVGGSLQWYEDCNRNSSTMLKETLESKIYDDKVCRRSSSNICKYWANGNCCRYGEHQCWNLHSWFDGVEQEFHEGNPKPIRLVWWTAPPENFVKINCDGALSHNQNKAAAGGVVRDSAGRFVTGFSSILTRCDTVLESELLAIKIGMEIAISRGFRNLVVESDSYSAIQLIKNGHEQSQNHHHPLAALVFSIIQIGKKAKHVSWNHVFRETNSVADGFAKHGLSLPPRFRVKHFESPPPFVLIPMCADQAGITYTR